MVQSSPVRLVDFRRIWLLTVTGDWLWGRKFVPGVLSTKNPKHKSHSHASLRDSVLTLWSPILAAQQASLEGFRKVLRLGSNTSDIVTWCCDLQCVELYLLSIL